MSPPKGLFSWFGLPVLTAKAMKRQGKPKSWALVSESICQRKGQEKASVLLVAGHLPPLLAGSGGGVALGRVANERGRPFRDGPLLRHFSD